MKSEALSSINYPRIPPGNLFKYGDPRNVYDFLREKTGYKELDKTELTDGMKGILKEINMHYLNQPPLSDYYEKTDWQLASVVVREGTDEADEGRVSVGLVYTNPDSKYRDVSYEEPKFDIREFIRAEALARSQNYSNLVDLRVNPDLTGMFEEAGLVVLKMRGGHNPVRVETENYLRRIKTQKTLYQRGTGVVLIQGATFATYGRDLSAAISRLHQQEAEKTAATRQEYKIRREGLFLKKDKLGVQISSPTQPLW